MAAGHMPSLNREAHVAAGHMPTTKGKGRRMWQQATCPSTTKKGKRKNAGVQVRVARA